jgi:hypothetical protein
MKLTRFPSLGLLTLAGSVLGSPIEKRDGCHKSGKLNAICITSRLTNAIADDSIGKYCAFQTPAAWDAAVNLYCAGFEFGEPVPQGGSYGIKLDQMPDGAGGQQIFWGTCGRHIFYCLSAYIGPVSTNLWRF